MYIIFYSYACMYHPLHEPELQPLTLALLNFVIAIHTIFYIIFHFSQSYKRSVPMNEWQISTQKYIKEKKLQSMHWYGFVNKL